MIDSLTGATVSKGYGAPAQTFPSPADQGSAMDLRPRAWSSPAPVGEIEVLTPSQWADLRSIRLRALKNSPGVFTATYATEHELDSETWQKRIASSTWIIARHGRAKIGTARLVNDPAQPKDTYVECVWVAPTYRHQGILRLLMADLATRARAQGSNELFLWVLDTNHGARDAYLKLGFEFTGTEQPIAPHGEPVLEVAKQGTTVKKTRHELQMRYKFVED